MRIVKQKMKDLSMCRYLAYVGVAILLVCGLTLFLSSCEDGWDGGGKYGKEVEVSFSIGGSAMGDGGSVTRSADESSTLETTVFLGDGWSMQAVLTPDTLQSQLRAVQTFPAGTRIRIVAYQMTGPNAPLTTPYAHLILTANGSPTTIGSMNLPAGLYRFAAYAYYNKSYAGWKGDDGYEDDLAGPDPIEIEASYSKDMLCGFTDQSVAASPPNNKVTIDLKHLYSSIVEISASARLTDNTATTLSQPLDVGFYMPVNVFLQLALDSVYIGSPYRYFLPFSNNSWFDASSSSSLPPSSVWSIQPDTVLAYPGSPTNVWVGSVTVDGHTFHDVSASFNTPLERNKFYRLQLNFVRGSLPNNTLIRSNQNYVGAFWRHDQWGERVIRIPFDNSNPNFADGAWAATVAWLDGNWDTTRPGAVLAMGDSPDPTIRTVSASNNAESYPLYTVHGSTTINGVATNGYITFRIGLQPTNLNPNPAVPRYGLVIIYYGPDKSLAQYIYLRQGEAADNLSTDSPHDQVLWLPYNVGRSDSPEYYGGGNFYRTVDYPTKSGYQYPWGHGGNMPSMVPLPLLPYLSTISNWQGVSPIAYFSLSSVCPDEYYLPEAGANDSQMASLLQGAGNNSVSSVFGYYADGFFDRRPIGIAPGTTAPSNSAVSSTNDHVGYQGRLFVNVNDHRSLFFPSAGFRRQSDATLDYAGNQGLYWSANKSTNTNAYYMTFSISSSASVTTGIASTAYNLRCVYNPFFILNPDILYFPALPSGAQTVAINTSLQGGWTVSSDQSWCQVSPSSGTGNGSLSVTCDPNKMGGPRRTATITATLGSYTATLTVIQAYGPGGDGDHILYIDGALTNARLAVGKWGVEVNSTNIAYFKFGSVVGMDASSTNYNSSVVGFNPTTISSFGAYANIPYFNDNGTDWKGIYVTTPPTFDASYHTLTNVQQYGKGDPCMLVGLAAIEIRNMNSSDFSQAVANAQWRTPTANENIRFSGGLPGGPWETWNNTFTGSSNSYTQSTGSGANEFNYWASSTVNPAHWPPVSTGTRYEGAWLPVVQGAVPNSLSGSFLPAAGDRPYTLNGALSSLGTVHFWSSQTTSTENYASLFERYNTEIYSNIMTNYRTGCSIRCVPIDN